MKNSRRSMLVLLIVAALVALLPAGLRPLPSGLLACGSIGCLTFAVRYDILVKSGTNCGPVLSDAAHSCAHQDVSLTIVDSSQQ